MPTELKGSQVDELHESGELFLKVELNKDDPEAVAQNKSKTEPMMLRDVYGGSGGEKYFGNVLLVDAGSVLNFLIKSSGPVGYGYRIRTDKEPIVDKLYRCDPDKPSEPLWDSVRRYQTTDKQGTGKLIMVDDARNYLSEQSRDSLALRWQCRITTWKVHGYSYQDIYYGVSRALTTVEASPGVIGGYGKSGQEFEKIRMINEDNPDNETNGYLGLYFFVYNDPQKRRDAVEVRKKIDMDL
jgi:hypothetical protein